MNVVFVRWDECCCCRLRWMLFLYVEMNVVVVGWDECCCMLGLMLLLWVEMNVVFERWDECCCCRSSFILKMICGIQLSAYFSYVGTIVVWFEPVLGFTSIVWSSTYTWTRTSLSGEPSVLWTHRFMKQFKLAWYLCTIILKTCNNRKFT